MQLEQLNKQIRELAACSGENPTGISYLDVYRFTDNKIKMPEEGLPYIYFVADGSMRLYTPSGIMDYTAGQYSVSSIDTPDSARVLTFSDKNDFIALAIRFSLDDVISVALDIDGDLVKRILNSELPDRLQTASDNKITDVIIRSLDIVNEPEQLAFMEKHLKREMIFNILCGTCGKQFLQSTVNIQQAGEIYEINSWIKRNYKKSFTVEELAEQRHMSVSNFHQKFKSAVGMGPLQCQKRLRLTEARRLMLDENANVTDAAIEVGYESVSQFIRDYHKMFDLSPKEDIQKLKKRLKARSE